MPPLRVGLIGCGRGAARVHLPVLAALGEVTVAAVAEGDARRRDICRTIAPAARVFADYRELLDVAGIEAVVICLPPSLHAEAAIAAFERGLHVYLEKPIATAVEDGDRVVGAWRRAGTVGRVGFNFRFHPLVVELRDALRSGAVGDIVGARTVFSAARRVLPEWKQARRAGGGALLDLASHHFDLARFLFDGEIAEVGALLRSVESEEDTAAVEVRLAAGPLVTIFAALAAVDEDRIEVYGTRGAVTLDRYRSSRLRFVAAARDLDRAERLRAMAAALTALPRVLRDIATPPRESSYARSFADFAGAVRGRGSAGPDLEDGLRSLEIVAAAERAATSGRVISMKDADA